MLRDTMDRILDKVHDKGLQQGIQRGREEGREQERVRTLSRLLARRFGERERREDDLLALSVEQKDELLDKIFEFDDEQELFDALVARR